MLYTFLQTSLSTSHLEFRQTVKVFDVSCQFGHKAATRQVGVIASPFKVSYSAHSQADQYELVPSSSLGPLGILFPACSTCLMTSCFFASRACKDRHLPQGLDGSGTLKAHRTPLFICPPLTYLHKIACQDTLSVALVERCRERSLSP